MTCFCSSDEHTRVHMKDCMLVENISENKKECYERVLKIPL